MSGFLGTAVGSILIPALLFMVGLTFVKDKKVVAKTLILVAASWTVVALIADLINPVTTYQEPSITIDEGMMKDYGHGVTAVDPVKVEIAQRRAAANGKYVVDAGQNIARIAPKLLLIIVMLVTFAVISAKKTTTSKRSGGRTKSKTNRKPKSKKHEDYDDGL